MLQKTYSLKASEISRQWFHADANDKVLGRLATRIAHVLRGKHKPSYTPHMDNGDFVVVTNAEKIRFTGDKLNQKKYFNYSGYRGGLKERTAKQMVEEKPEEVIKLAVKGMLPKGPLGRQMLSKLKVYAGQEHPHEAQQPETLDA